MRLNRYLSAVAMTCALISGAVRAATPTAAPDTRDWVNEGKWPRSPDAVEVTPESQLAKARNLDRIGSAAQAADQYKRLANAYKESEQAEEGLVLSAKDFLAAGDFTNCKTQLEELRRRYANPAYLDAIGEVEIQLGRGFLEGKGEGGTYTFASRIRKAVKIFKTQFEKDPQGRWADDALLGLGEASEAIKKYEKAIKYYKELLAKYPRSELRAEAEGHIAACINKNQPQPDYTESETEEARKRIQLARDEALVEDVDLDLGALAEDERVLRMRQAKKRYDQAVFYQKNGHYRAAEEYYELLKNTYQDSPYAEKSIERLKELRRR